MQIRAAKGDAALGWIAGAAPLVNEDCRPLARLRIWPVPIHHQNQIIERITSTQGLVAVSIGGADVVVIGDILTVIRPQVARANGFGPLGWAANAIWAK